MKEEDEEEEEGEIKRWNPRLIMIKRDRERK